MEAESTSGPMPRLTNGHCSLTTGLNLAGAEGFEPPSSVLETDSLAVELTPLNSGVRCQVSGLSLVFLPLAAELTRHGSN